MSQAALDRGYRLVELLKQPLNSPMPVQEQVVSLYAGTQGYLDPIPVEDVPRYEARAARVDALPPRWSARGHQEQRQHRGHGRLRRRLKGFADSFQASDGSSAAAEPTPAEVVAADEALADDTEAAE